MAHPADLVPRTKFLVKLVLAGAAILLVLLISIFLVVPHETMAEPIIVFWGIFILIAALIAGIAVAYLFQTRTQMSASDGQGGRAVATAATSAVVSAPELEDLAIRLLDGDERRLMRVIVEARGDILQKELVRVTAFSDAKVSRLLDRLEERGLVVRERRGMSNRVRLTLKET
ncbi:MAG TPA: MarR family transcriptional regulator [Thermoplasmata archaeon]|nr:MarR family transcriptional regulator [Thermoplasmata archaeon]